MWPGFITESPSDWQEHTVIRGSVRWTVRYSCGGLTRCTYLVSRRGENALSQALVRPGVDALPEMNGVLRTGSKREGIGRIVISVSPRSFTP